MKISDLLVVQSFVLATPERREHSAFLADLTGESKEKVLRAINLATERNLLCPTGLTPKSKQLLLGPNETCPLPLFVVLT